MPLPLTTTLRTVLRIVLFKYLRSQRDSIPDSRYDPPLTSETDIFKESREWERLDESPKMVEPDFDEMEWEGIDDPPDFGPDTMIA